MKALNVYVGWDSREDIAFRVCKHSIVRHARSPVEVFPLKQPSLRELGLYRRRRDAASTEFSLTRFLTPYLAATDDWCVFVDCDFLFTADVAALTQTLDRSKAVYVVQHDYVPRYAEKMDGQTQTTYPRKNWSSFIVFNGAHPAVQSLTPQAINTMSPAELHRFTWAADADIGALDLGWNFLEGEYERPAKPPQAIHYTNGGPWFDQWQNVDFGDLWRAERELYLRSAWAEALPD
ncbi:hypothetical protein [Muricoccus radiodurans]|uniref:hypothetical protein n=1 Tax=Muricoccus radiodurans TaxID=2231721 RepID=UPI003CF0D44D